MTLYNKHTFFMLSFYVYVLICILPLCLMQAVLAVSLSEPIQPLMTPVPQGSSRVIALGERLFNDPLFSADNSVSCSSCHKLESNGADNVVPSIGINNAKGIIKTPTVYNSCLNFVQFWDGRAATLQEQLDGPISNPLEMGSSWKEVIRKLNNHADYRKIFSRLYDDGITEKNVKHALLAFECSLITLDAPFDRYLLGDSNAISIAAKEGYRLFTSYGCIACHHGRNVGGNMFQKMGVMGDYFRDRGGPLTKADMGRFNVSGNEMDRHMFKVPSLRLAVKNAPYFHDGSGKTLEQAIKTMAKYQLGRNMPEQDVAKIIRFLETLVGKYPHLQP